MPEHVDKGVRGALGPELGAVLHVTLDPSGDGLTCVGDDAVVVWVSQWPDPRPEVPGKEGVPGRETVAGLGGVADVDV